MLKSGEMSVYMISKTKLINKIKKMQSIHNMFKLVGCKKPKMVLIEMVNKEDVIKIIKEEWTKIKKQS